MAQEECYFLLIYSQILCDCDALYSAKPYPNVEKFLRSSVESTRAIHHMVEFTFVLLNEMAASEEKSRTQKLLQDLLGYCSLMKYVLESIDPHPVLGVRTPFRLLADTQKWSRRSTAALVSSIEELKRKTGGCHRRSWESIILTTRQDFHDEHGN